MTTINQLLSLIEMSGMKGDDIIALRVGEDIAPMESCTFQEIDGRTALMFQGGRKQRAATETSDRQWLIRKRGYYYRPNRSGYTAFIAEAGRYTEAEAKAEAAIQPLIMQAIPLSQAEESERAKTTDAGAAVCPRENCPICTTGGKL